MAEIKPEQPVNHAPVAKKPNVVAGEPGFALGLAGFIASFIVGIVGLVLSAIALSQSKKVGKRNTFAFVGLIIGIVQTVIALLIIAAITAGTVYFINYCRDNADACREHYDSNSNNSQYERPSDSYEQDQTY